MEGKSSKNEHIDKDILASRKEILRAQDVFPPFGAVDEAKGVENEESVDELAEISAGEAVEDQGALLSNKNRPKIPSFEEMRRDDYGIKELHEEEKRALLDEVWEEYPDSSFDEDEVSSFEQFNSIVSNDGNGEEAAELSDVEKELLANLKEKASRAEQLISEIGEKLSFSEDVQQDEDLAGDNLDGEEEDSAAIPKFDLAEQILAEQRKESGKRRMGPGGRKITPEPAAVKAELAAEVKIDNEIMESRDYHKNDEVAAKGIEEMREAEKTSLGKRYSRQIKDMVSFSQRRIIADIVSRDIASFYKSARSGSRAGNPAMW